MYRANDDMHAVSFDPVSGEVGTPTRLFHLAAATSYLERSPDFDVTRDGSRFLFVVPVARPEALPNVVVLNWFEELTRKVPR